MKLIAAVLLVGAFFFNFSYNWVPDDSRFTPWAVWYMQQGLWVAVLSWVVIELLREKPKTKWRDLGIAGAIISALEGLNTAIPRLFVVDPSKIPKGQAVIDFVTGFPAQATLVSLYLLILCFSVIRK